MFDRNGRPCVAGFKYTNLIMMKRRHWKCFCSSAKFISSIDFFRFPKLCFLTGPIFGDNFIFSFFLIHDTLLSLPLVIHMSDFLFMSFLLGLFSTVISAMSFRLKISLEISALKSVSYICVLLLF